MLQFAISLVYYIILWGEIKLIKAILCGIMARVKSYGYTLHIKQASECISTFQTEPPSHEVNALSRPICIISVDTLVYNL